MSSEKISRRTTYEPSEEIWQILERYRKEHKTEGFKETIEGLIWDLIKRAGLVQSAEKPAETPTAPSTSAPGGNLLSSPLGSQQAQQPFKPKINYKALGCPKGWNPSKCAYEPCDRRPQCKQEGIIP